MLSAWSAINTLAITTIASAPASGGGAVGAGVALDLLAILATAGLVALVMKRFHVATIPGYLIAGAIIGPAGLAVVKDPASTQAITQLATILLMFTIGLHMDVAELRQGVLPIMLVGVASTIAVALVGWPIGVLAGLSAPAALAVSMALSISCTAVVLRLLEQRRELHATHGRVVFGVVLTQDLVALAMLALMPVLRAWAGEPPGGAGLAIEDAASGGPLIVLSRASLAIGGLALILVLGRWALPRLLREAAGSSAELLLVVSAACALAAAVATGWLGVSPELGAFLAGFLLASTPFRYQLAGQLMPMRDLFMAVFFTAVGLELSLGAVVTHWSAVGAALLALVIGKALIIGATAWLFGATPTVAARSGFTLAQGGEFSLVILGQAAATGVLSADANGVVLAAVVLSIMVTPVLVQGGAWAGERLRRAPAAWWTTGRGLRLNDDPGDADGGDGRGDTAIIAGFGPIGRAVADALERLGWRVTVVDLNPRTVRTQSDLGRRAVYGDASNAEVLVSAGIERAVAVILTMPDEDAVLRACQATRAIRPDVLLAARANVLAKGLQALQLGANELVVEEMAAAEVLAGKVTAALARRTGGAPTGTASNGVSGRPGAQGRTPAVPP